MVFFLVGIEILKHDLGISNSEERQESKVLPGIQASFLLGKRELNLQGLVNGFGGILIADLYHLPIIGLL